MALRMSGLGSTGSVSNCPCVPISACHTAADPRYHSENTAVIPVRRGESHRKEGQAHLQESRAYMRQAGAHQNIAQRRTEQLLVEKIQMTQVQSAMLGKASKQLAKALVVELEHGKWMKDLQVPRRLSTPHW